MAHPLRFLVVAGLLTALAVGAGVLLRPDAAKPAPAKRPTPFSTTALTDVDTTASVVTRGAFCDAVDDRQVDAVLGEVPDVQAWSNGDKTDVGDGTTDVVHEFGCRYVANDGSVAQAWVFAPQVGAAQAQRLVASAGKARDCQQPTTAPLFGSPTLAMTCSGDGTTSASYRGLFGDAWLVCEVDRPTAAATDPAALLDQAGRWCVGVLQAVGNPSSS